ncbi:MAG: hypothetical protein H6708_17070 [Kofleriaceae bacterium]|nr:hypothetical protein [Kofleriaceae bacterium]
MPRRTRNLTPSDGRTPTEGSVTPTHETPPPLPRPPALPTGGRGAARGPARPGRRGDVPSDMQMTSKIERVRGDPTPAPLPPSPGARDAERYFEQVPTNPALRTQGGALDPTGSHRRAKASQQYAGTAPTPALIERPWLLPTLIAAVALTIGMILGALLFGERAATCPPCPDSARAAKPAIPDQK